MLEQLEKFGLSYSATESGVKTLVSDVLQVVEKRELAVRLLTESDLLPDSVRFTLRSTHLDVIMKAGSGLRTTQYLTELEATGKEFPSLGN